jgi:hypothetical protein
MRLAHYQTLIGSQLESDKKDIAEFSRAGLEVYGYRAEQDIRQLLDDELRHSAAVDTALAHWCIHRHFPPRSAEVAYYSTKRFCAAAELLDVFATLNIETSDQETHFLHWLLVDYWQFAGRALWNHRVRST